MTAQVLIILACSGLGILVLWLVSKPRRQKDRRDRPDGGSGGIGGDSPPGDVAPRGNSRDPDSDGDSGSGGGDGGGGGGGD